MRWCDETRPGGFLAGIAAGAARPFRYRNRVAELLGRASLDLTGVRAAPPQAVDLDLVYRRAAAAGHGYVPSTPAQAPAGHDRPGLGPGRRPAVSHAQDTEPAAFRPRGSGSDVGSGFTAEYGDEPGAAP
jgi:hypothetical protein